ARHPREPGNAHDGRRHSFALPYHLRSCACRHRCIYCLRDFASLPDDCRRCETIFRNHFPSRVLRRRLSRPNPDHSYLWRTYRGNLENRPLLYRFRPRPRDRHWPRRPGSAPSGNPLLRRCNCPRNDAGTRCIWIPASLINETMEILRRPLAPGETNHELLWLTVSSGGLVLAATWLALKLPCPIGLFHALTGPPCLTCGATRSAAAFFHAHFLVAFQWNPLAFLFYCALSIFNLYALAVIGTRAPRVRIAELTASERKFIRGAIIALFALNWIYLLIANPSL